GQQDRRAPASGRLDRFRRHLNRRRRSGTTPSHTPPRCRAITALGDNTRLEWTSLRLSGDIRAANLPVYEVRRVSQGGRGRPRPSLDLPACRAPGLRGEPVSTARRPPAAVPLPACGLPCAYAYP